MDVMLARSLPASVHSANSAGLQSTDYHIEANAASAPVPSSADILQGILFPAGQEPRPAGSDRRDVHGIAVTPPAAGSDNLKTGGKVLSFLPLMSRGASLEGRAACPDMDREVLRKASPVRTEDPLKLHGATQAVEIMALSREALHNPATIPSSVLSPDGNGGKQEGILASCKPTSKDTAVLSKPVGLNLQCSAALQAPPSALPCKSDLFPPAPLAAGPASPDPHQPLNASRQLSDGSPRSHLLAERTPLQSTAISLLPVPLLLPAATPEITPSSPLDVLVDRSYMQSLFGSARHPSMPRPGHGPGSTTKRMPCTVHFLDADCGVPSPIDIFEVHISNTKERSLLSLSNLPADLGAGGRSLVAMTWQVTDNPMDKDQSACTGASASPRLAHSLPGSFAGSRTQQANGTLVLVLQILPSQSVPMLIGAPGLRSGGVLTLAAGNADLEEGSCAKHNAAGRFSVDTEAACVKPEDLAAMERAAGGRTGDPRGNGGLEEKEAQDQLLDTSGGSLADPSTNDSDHSSGMGKLGDEAEAASLEVLHSRPKQPCSSRQRDYRITVPRRDVHSLFGDHPKLPILVILRVSILKEEQEGEQKVFVKGNGPRDYVMTVLEPMLGVIKAHTKHGWTIGQAADHPILILDLAPRSKSTAIRVSSAACLRALPLPGGGRAPSGLDCLPLAQPVSIGATNVVVLSKHDHPDDRLAREIKKEEPQGTAAAPAPTPVVAPPPPVRVQRRAAAISRLSFLKAVSHEGRSPPGGPAVDMDIDGRGGAGADGLKQRGSRRQKVGSVRSASGSLDAEERTCEGAAAAPAVAAPVHASASSHGRPLKAARMGSLLDGGALPGAGIGTHSAAAAASGGRRLGKGCNRMPVVTEGVAEAAEAEAAAALSAGDDTLECPWTDLWHEDGSKWSGGRYRGLVTGRNKLFADRRCTNQVTKSCHFCQNQHIYVECRHGASSKKCVKSYCRSCTSRYFPNMSFLEVCHRCPFCRGICNCKPCLRQENDSSFPEYAEATRHEFARFGLSYIAQPLAEWLRLEDEEARFHGFDSLEDVPSTSMNGERVLCDKCAASIPNLHFSCQHPQCGWDICVRCASRDRLALLERGGPAAEAECPNQSFHNTAPNEGSAQQLPAFEGAAGMDSPWVTLPLRARRFFDDGRLEILRKVVGEFEGQAPDGPADLAAWSTRLAHVAGPSHACTSSQQGAGKPPLQPAPSASVRQQELAVDGREADPERSAALVQLHRAMRLPGGRDPEVRSDGRVLLWGHMIRLQDVRRVGWQQAAGTGAGASPGARAAQRDVGRQQAAGTGAAAGSPVSRVSHRDGGRKQAALAGQASGPPMARASQRGADFMFTPHVSRLTQGHPDFEQYLQIFLERWQARQPVVVRGVSSRMQWSPDVMLRATREQGSKRFRTDSADTNLQVLDCRGFTLQHMSQHAFFQHYMSPTEVYDNGSPRMLKVKDWPPEEHFSVRMVRHNQDFLEMLPLPVYTHPRSAPLNLATMLPGWANATDLGPKTCIANGQVEEHEIQEADSVTKLHQGVSDVVNVMVHCQAGRGEGPAGPTRCGLEPAVRGSSYGSAGALWDVWRAEDADALRADLLEHASEFVHHGERIRRDKVGDAVFDQCFMVGSSHIDRMAAGSAGMRPVTPWRFEQNQDEAVFIPAGCPHQIRNMRSCIKIGVDFVSPEALRFTLDMAERLERCPRDTSSPPDESIYQDSLQSRLIVMSSAVECYLKLHPELGPSVPARANPLNKREALRNVAAEVVVAESAAAEEPIQPQQPQPRKRARRQSRAPAETVDDPEAKRATVAAAGGASPASTAAVLCMMSKAVHETRRQASLSLQRVGASEEAGAVPVEVSTGSQATPGLQEPTPQTTVQEGSPGVSVAVPLVRLPAARGRKQKTVQRSAMQ